MSTIDLKRPSTAVTPPVCAVSEREFGTLGIIKVAERAVKRHGNVVTLALPGGRDVTLLATAAHARLWQDDPDAFIKDVADPGTAAHLTRQVLGRNLLSAAEGAEWAAMRAEMTQILGRSKPWFQRPLACATRTLIADLRDRPHLPLLEHCIAWATRAICEPMIGHRMLDHVANDLVMQLARAFMTAVPGGAAPDISAHYTAVMARLADDHGPNSVAELVLKGAGPDDDRAEMLRATVGGLLVASLHINALSLFWVLAQIAELPALQDNLAAEAAPYGYAPRRVLDTPLAFACIRESQRTRPIMAFIERQLARPMAIDGFAIPRGATVLFSPWLVQRGAAWSDATRFDPANFGPARKPAPGSYFPFGIGRRVCPGTNLVNQQLTFAVAGIAAALRLAPDPCGRPGDMAPFFRVNLEPRGPVRIRVETR